jgi:LysR family transcriptional regulator, low CO2-responsive transcriptional regulator
MSGLHNATLRQLQIFAAAARHQSFSRASTELHLTQPAVSMQVRQLEESAGVSLFERVGRRVCLTSAGQELLTYTQRILGTIQDAEDTFATIKAVGSGRLTIAAVSTAKYFAPKLLAQFQQRHPNVELRLAVNNREAVVAQLTANETDLAIMGTPPHSIATESAPFAPHPLVVIAPPEHHLAPRKRIPLRELEGETFIVRERGSGTRSAMELHFRKFKLRIKLGMETSSNETIKQAVMAGMGLAFISQHTLGVELTTNRLTILRVQTLPVMRQWNLVHRREKRLSPAAIAFKTFMLETGPPFLERWSAA